MSRELIIKEIRDFIDQRVNGIGGNPHQAGYKHDFLKIFRHAQKEGLLDDSGSPPIATDNINDTFDARWPEDLNSPEFKAMLKDMCRTWDEWRFLVNNPEDT